ncbi:hypothetical protein Lal_00035499 [Lupinus albus]|nr:hypothetical protein Lal_00035499 [Lupinus albus]
MDSSSRIKKQCTNASERKQQTSSGANLLDFPLLLATKEQHVVFTKHFLGRPLFAPKYGKLCSFEFDDFQFLTLLRQQNMFMFCKEYCVYYRQLVRVFYCNLN